MPKFDIRINNTVPTVSKIGDLIRNGKVLVDEFYEDIKNDNNLKNELGVLLAHLVTVANNKQLPKSKRRSLKLINGVTTYELKSRHLRLYVILDQGHYVVIGGKKTTQPKDIKRLKQLAKEYQEYKNGKNAK